MKARARLLTFLVCLMGIAGFGFSTPDLAINSVVAVYEVHDEGPIAVIQKVEKVHLEAAIVVGYVGKINKTSFRVSDQSILTKEDKLKSNYTGKFYIPPLARLNEDNIKHNNAKELNLRKPRDGIRMVS